MHFTYWNKLILLLAVVATAASCSSTKYVPEGKQLLNKSEIKVEGNGLTADDIASYTKQKPNKRIFFVRFHLGMYNLSSPRKVHWPSSWLRRIGEEPVIFDDYMHKRSVEQVGLYLKSKGFYNYELSDTIIFSSSKKVSEYFAVKLNQPYTIDSIFFTIPDTLLRSKVIASYPNSLVQKGVPFDKDILENERGRISSVLRNQGYYQFNKNFITFVADTTLGNKRVALEVKVANFPEKTDDGKIVRVPHQIYKIKEIKVYPSYDGVKAIMDSTYLSGYTESEYKGIKLFNRDEFKLRSSTVYRTNLLLLDSLYSEKNVSNTYNNFSSLRLFRTISFQFTDIKPDPSAVVNHTEPLFDEVVDSSKHVAVGHSAAEPGLSASILLLPFSQQSYTVELEGTNSSGDYGFAANLTHQHKNLFHGAEIFESKVKGAFEFLKKKGSNSFGSSIETGVSTSLTIPRFLMPIPIDDIHTTYNPKTQISASYNFQRRPDYTRTVLNVTFGYRWNQTKRITIIANPVDVNIVDLPVIESSFYDSIKDIFLRNSYENHIVAGASYSVIYSNRQQNKPISFTLFRINVDMAGNLLQGGNALFNEPQPDGNYKFMGTRFAQYFRSEATYTFNQVVNDANTFVYRAFVGVGIPYGNSKVLPIERQFFAGGANSNRGWQVRSLGPGSYKDISTSGYSNASSDMKLEANFEYRFKLFWKLEGAYFVDAGNIWALSTTDTRVGAAFDLNRFYKEIAVGTGFGVRFNFGFFIFRIDAGLKVYDPAERIDSRVVIGSHPIHFKDFAFHFGINYPF